ncbi:LysR family transcriptional regulator ArgP [Pseudomonas shirazensis]|uniref:LysR family transcriptional regulator ArgP n=1 Tax=Pseudomonas shirazensis TaxID=2745494 RepID=UPI00164613C6|nr:LysR family transcriptional regulator ArgP [Pseudomonas shirazensis]MBV4500533.1 LysR family transcriptional regulator ArgP [Pseudomonas shirazensis]
MKIDNLQLTAFSSVIREGSFEGAARKLHITASAISQRIKQLEDRVGQVLIMRGSPCKATPAGITLLKFTEKIDFLENELNQDLGLLDNGFHNQTRIPIAVNADSLDTWFIDVVEWVKNQSNLTFDIRIEDQDHSQALLRDGNVVAAVSGSHTAAPGCQVEHLGKMRYIALASRCFHNKHFSAGLSTETLSKAPLLAFNHKDEIQHSFMRLILNIDLAPPVNYLPTFHSFFEALERGLGWGMAPAVVATTLIDSKLLVNIAPNHYVDIPLYWHRWRCNSKNLELLTAAVRKHAMRSLLPS